MNSSTSSSDLLEAGMIRRITNNCYSPIIIALVLSSSIETIAHICYDPATLGQTFAPRSRIPTPGESIVQSKLDFVYGGRNHVDLLIVGDSSGLMGVDTLRLQSATGMSAYNLCTVGFLGIDGHRYMLERYIDRHGIPDCVIYHVAPEVMFRDEQKIHEVGWLSRLKWHLGIDREWLPSLNYREHLQQWTTGGKPASVNNHNVTRGHWPSHNDVLSQLEENKGSCEETVVTDWQSAPILTGDSSFQLAALKRLGDMSEEYGISLYVICNPLPRIAVTPKNKESLKALELAMTEALSSAENSRLFTPLFRYYDNDLCATLNHLHPTAIEANTDAIANWLGDHASRPAMLIPNQPSTQQK